MTRMQPILLALPLAACASYSPNPLSDTPAMLDAPTSATLTQATAGIARPYLTPATIDLAAPLDPNAVATIAVITNPDLKALRAKAGVSDAQAFAARLMPDPTFSIGAHPVLSGPDPLTELVGALGLDLNALRTRGVQRRQARAQAEQARLDLAWAEWQTAGQARMQAVRILGFEKSVAIERQTLAAQQNLLRHMLAALGRGDIAADRAQAARTAAYDAETRLRTDEASLATARGELDKLLGLPPATQLQLTEPALPAPPPDAAALFTLARAKRADLAALRAGYAAQEAAVHRAILDQFPTLNLTLDATRDTTGNKILGPTVDFTLPLWNRNRGGIAIERATRAQLKAEYDARLFQTRADIAAAVEGIAIARKQRDAAATSLPSLERYAAASRRAADRGDLSTAAAETAEQALRDQQALLAASDEAIREQTIALELLTGTPRQTWPH
ncbi:outer membrane protein TolC [Hephaestia caeni]|uniref:Outer membrane protein TolC n=1 Tax=Hephaestia caeni TaxID=645617 RepID=A0A397PJA5_9SPHN|nr:TolC family protein [Hephaestia caeni]RIA45771.1 outer membrane protein TolC [Hephaestia caeni]